MNDLLFYLTILALLYYFFYYQPSHKKLNTTNPPLTKPLTHSQFTQTDSEKEGVYSELSQTDLTKTLDTLIKSIQELNNEL